MMWIPEIIMVICGWHMMAAPVSTCLAFVFRWSSEIGVMPCLIISEFGHRFLVGWNCCVHPPPAPTLEGMHQSFSSLTAPRYTP